MKDPLYLQANRALRINDLLTVKPVTKLLEVR
jgi:hypothetical protein